MQTKDLDFNLLFICFLSAFNQVRLLLTGGEDQDDAQHGNDNSSGGGGEQREQCDVNATTVDGCTALHAAAQSGNVDMVKLLLQHGANVSAAMNDGCTALWAATLKGHGEIRKSTHRPV